MGRFLKCRPQPICTGAIWQGSLKVQITGPRPRAAESEFLCLVLGKPHF